MQSRPAIHRCDQLLEIACVAHYQTGIHVERHVATTGIRVDRIDTAYRLYEDLSGFYMANGEYIAADGQQGCRTRVYINVEAARRALDRGELYTRDEYAELTTINHQGKRR